MGETHIFGNPYVEYRWGSPDSISHRHDISVIPGTQDGVLHSRHIHMLRCSGRTLIESPFRRCCFPAPPHSLEFNLWRSFGEVLACTLVSGG